MRIFVIADVHANLLALRAALAVIEKTGGDAIFHIGDAFDIGPFPAECLDVLLNTPKMHFVMGNHDAWFAHGLPEPRPTWLGEGEEQHYRWTHANISAHLKSIVAQWSYSIERKFEGVQTTFVHYGLRPCGEDFVDIIKQPTAQDLDSMFEQHHSELVFYGHHHVLSDIQGQARYINPGSLGCSEKAVAKYTVVDFEQDKFVVQHRGVAYDDTELYRAFEQRKVPEREFIYRAFYGNRF